MNTYKKKGNTVYTITVSGSTELSAESPKYSKDPEEGQNYHHESVKNLRNTVCTCCCDKRCSPD